MKKYLYETKEWEEMLAEAEANAAALGGSTGSNMAEEPYIPPNVKEILKGIPAEELAKTDAEIDALLAK